MPLTQDDWTDQVVRSVGGTLPGGPAADPVTAQMVGALAPLVGGLWDLAAVWAARFVVPYRVTVRYHYCRRLAVDVLLGQVRARINVSLGRLKLTLSEWFKNLVELRKQVDKDLADEIAAARLARNSAAPVLARLLATAPVEANPYVPPAGPGQPVRPAALRPDPNAPWTSGDPLCPDPYSTDLYFPGGY